MDPYKATIGVGLGLPGYQPGVSDKISLTNRDWTNIEDYFAKMFFWYFRVLLSRTYDPVKLCICFGAMSD